MFNKIIIALLAFMLLSTAVLADGILFPVERPNSPLVVPNELFSVKYHHVDVNINDQVCVTKVDQIFHNDASADREGMYVFPVPEGSAITRFSMFAGEQEIKGKILDKTEARNIYESIVRQRKDPALLEYIDRNTFRASVYPVPANGDKRIRLDYSEVLTKTGNTCRYVYSLSTERFSARPLENCRVTIRIHSKRPITNIYSPTHTIDVDRISDNEATVTWKAENTKPDTDLVLYYTVSSDDVGIDLLSYKLSGENGYYLLLASPRVEVDKSKIQPKNVVFVLDRTGSMAGNKIDQTKDAIRFCLNSLNKDDKFNVITFNESPDPVFKNLHKAAARDIKAALGAVDSVDASGGTDIDGALKAAMMQFGDAGSTRNYIIFLTDGQPTVAVTDPNTILSDAANANKNNVKIFAFGVGYDVNTHLLDKLTEQSKGDSDYVRPNENIEVKVSSFYAKVSDPLLTDVKLKISGVETSDSFPSGNLPDIFKGSQLLVLGRYSGSGSITVELSGIANGTRKTFKLNTKLQAEEKSNEFLPQLWASRKIGYLLDEIRLHSSKELIDEVVRLSKEYGIPTEYTSFFADDRKYVADTAVAIQATATALDKGKQAESGSWGVTQSINARASKNQAQSPQAMSSSGYNNINVIGKVAANSRIGGYYYDKNDQLVAVANVQNIARRTFYQRGDYWEDDRVKPNQKFINIKQFSDAHFKLLSKYPRLSQYSTLGNIRLVLENNQAIEIGPNGKDSLSDKEIDELLKGIHS